MRDRGEKRDTFGAEVRGEDLRAAALRVDACLLVGAALLLHVGGAGRSSLATAATTAVSILVAGLLASSWASAIAQGW